MTADRLPQIDQPAFDLALERWSQNTPENYEIEVTVEGSQPGIYFVKFVDSQVQSAFRNGHPLKDQRTLGTWAVLGMFRTIGRDLANQDKARRDQTLPKLVLQGEFHPQYGYPNRYRRIEWGSSYQLNWHVSKFSVVPETNGSAAGSYE